MLGRKILKNSRRVLGLNERSLEFIMPLNHRKAVQIADDKVLTKEVLSASGIPVPNTIAILSGRADLELLDFSALPKSFVIKPVQGVRGGGVEIFYNRDKEGNFIKGDRSKISQDGIKSLCRDILDGQYSLHNEPDRVLIEERVKPHKAFRYYTYKGAPDVRVIVYNNIPIMSYVRLPTEESNGKANLDKGAIGAGIDMAVGKTTYAIVGKSQPIEYVPVSKLPLSGLKIPFWDKILHYAVEASKVTGLGFGAMDFLIDRENGPLIVEINARPGLSIQLANEDGLRRRLKKASEITVKSTEKGVRLAKDLFGGEIEQSVEDLTGKDVIGIYETIKVIGINEKEQLAKAKIDTGADSTSIDTNIAERLGYGELLAKFGKKSFPQDISAKEGLALARTLEAELKPLYPYLNSVNLVRSSHGSSLRPLVEITLQIADTRFETKATIYDRENLKYPVIIGRKSLSKFLVDPGK